MNPRYFNRHRRIGAVALSVGVLVSFVPAHAALIGVLSDGRQAEYLSLLGSSSAAARLALAQDGHELITIGSLALPVLNTVEVLWLPLLDVGRSYTAQERANIVQFAVSGGRVVWIGDADVYNGGDNSLLSAFGMGKLTGNLNAALTPDPSAAWHPVLSGPHGSVQQVAANTGYGLFTAAAGVVGVFTGENTQEPPQAGVLAGFLSAESGFAGAGRVVFVCESSLFGHCLLYTSPSPRDS